MATSLARRSVLAATESSAPFLYHTRTITAVTPSLRALNRLPRRTFSTRNATLATNDVPEDKPPMNKDISIGFEADETPKPRRSYLQKRAASVSSRRPVGLKQPVQRSNSKKITFQEKETFKNLLEKLKTKRGDPGQTDASNSLSAEKQAEVTELMSIFDSLLQESNRKQKREHRKQNEANSKPTRPEQTTIEEEISEDKGPQRINLDDLGYTEAATPGAAITITMKEAIDIVVQRESEHIEFALFQAIEEGKGDMGVWEVCKARIFSMLNHVESQPAHKVPRSAGPLRVPAVVPIAPVVASLYPKTLLIAFRVLNTHFPGSPLIGQFRSNIKEHGRLSSLLGASSGLYDEMLYFHWRGCKDLPGVVSLLREMEVIGLTPSSKSRGMLTALVIRRNRDLEKHREDGGGEHSFWDLPSNKEAFEALTCRGGWMDKVEARAEEDARRRESHRKFRG
ncbi:uncharacterized protein N7511_002112 [Penicillium nucicola]|uniref:uncharacterized protein n=1 Tax=Penicillium nucicola TaxID=1850975 RepID=UPI002545A02D|nr:uncharacterized protein N7511_002112 [Penicillium nucicola]KAJ5770061.1 hypothetical protein N7511_002112 [Penicillium nucicola]